MQHRRTFIRNAGLTVLGTGLVSAIPMEVLAVLRRKITQVAGLRVGLIGCKGMGWSNLTSILKIPEVSCTALCDIDKNIVDQRNADLAKINLHPKLYGDYRELLADKNVDIVIIATPDHWHCLQLNDALKAGKHVYVEKPIANSIEESRQMVKAVQQSGKAVQVGQWQRSQEHFQSAIAYVQSGKLGRIVKTKTWQFNGSIKALPIVPDEVVPSGIDYDMWLGPARKRPFNKNRFHYEFRWFWDYAGGTMTDWGVHLIDMVLMGMKASDPISISCSGGKYSFPGDARETPHIQTALYEFDNFEMVWEHTMGIGGGNYGLGHGIAFIGENGTMVLNRNGWDVRPEKLNGQDKIPAVAWQPSTDRGLDKHMVNFVEAVKSGRNDGLNCSIEAGARVAIISHMGNIAYRTGRKIFWDKNLQAFTDKEANGFIRSKYHNGWKFPGSN